MFSQPNFDLINTTQSMFRLPTITEEGFSTTTSSDTSNAFTNLEKLLFLIIGITVTLLILQSLCFIICILRIKRKQKHRRECSLKSTIREPLSNEENNSERYSSRPLKQVSDPQIYESLKDLIEPEEAAPPLPPIATLPRQRQGEKQLLDTLTRYDAEDKELVNSIATRPRLPLPNEKEAPQLPSKNNIFATMPRTPLAKPVQVMSSTMSRYPRESPHTNIHKVMPKKPEIPPPIHPLNLSSVSHHIPLVNPPDIRTLPKPRSPEGQKEPPPIESNHEIPIENELLQKLKKRAQLIPQSPQEIPVQQITNIPTRIQPQQTKDEPYNELMQKLKKRAALITDSPNDQKMQQPQSPVQLVQTPKYKPLPPTPRQSDYVDGWDDNFDTIEPLEQIHMYNI